MGWFPEGDLNQLIEVMIGAEPLSPSRFSPATMATERGLSQFDLTNIIVGAIVGADIYDHLEKVVDRFEDVAKRVSRIVLEHL